MTLTVAHFTRRRNLKAVPWPHTDVVPFKNMVNLTFIGSKPSGSPCSPLMWLVHFSSIRFLKDLPLNTYNSFDGSSLVPVTPKWEGEETENRLRETWAQLLAVPLLSWVRPASWAPNEKLYGGIYRGREYSWNDPIAFSFLAQIIFWGRMVVVVDRAGNKQTQ